MKLKHPKEYIYLIASDDVPGVSKIGWTTDVSRRLRDLQIGSPVPLRVVGYWPGSRELESWLHEHFAAIRGPGEWFRFRGEDRGYARVNDAVRRFERRDFTPKISPYVQRKLASLREDASAI